MRSTNKLMMTTTMVVGLLLLAGNTAATPGSLPVTVLSELHPSPTNLLSRRDMIGELIAMRGGQSGSPYQQSENPYEQQQTYYGADDSSNIGNSQDYENGFANYNPPPTSDDYEAREVGMFQESVQDRHDKWRTAQMEKYANLTPDQELNPRDDQGRMKLLSSVSKGSRAFIFFILMWRDIYLFDVTDQSIKGSFRKTICRAFLTTVFLGNLAGVVTSVTSQGHSSKNRLKAILNLDKLVETMLLLWNLGRVTLFPSKFVEREIFVAGILHSIFFLIQCQAFTRVNWDEGVAPVPQPQQQRQQQYEQQSNQQGFGQASASY